jgi:hypothetical protein
MAYFEEIPLRDHSLQELYRPVDFSLLKFRLSPDATNDVSSHAVKRFTEDEFSLQDNRWNRR